MVICNNKKCSIGECDQWKECAGYVPVVTNADRIRAMSDEELAETMYGMVNLDERIRFCQNKAECNALLERNEEIPEQYCIGCLVEWLKQPAEEVTPNG